MLVMEDTENHNDVSDIRYDKWPLATWVDSPIFRWLREIFLPMLVKEHAEYPEPDQDDESWESLLPEQDRNESTLPCVPLQKAVLICSFPG